MIDKIKEIFALSAADFFKQYWYVFAILLFLIILFIVLKVHHERKQADKIINRIILVDSVTNAATKKAFLLFSDRMIKKYNQYAIASFDINGFNYLNKKYSYVVGDKILNKIASTVFKQLSKTEMIARDQNDCFLCLIKYTEKMDVVERIRQLTDLISNLSISGDPLNLTTTWGFYFIKDKDNLFSAVENADIARTKAKGRFRNACIEFDEKMLREKINNKTIEAEMGPALANHEFKVYYQGKFDPVTGAVAGAEGLVRWIKNGQIIPPYQFIPLFEENGFIQRIDLEILEQICIYQRSRLDRNKKIVRISFNLSRFNLHDSKIVEKVTAIVDKYQVPHEFIEVEITESAVFDEYELFTGAIAAFHKQGFYVAMDDFGSGYSSLTCLSTADMDIVKIDRSFIKNNLAEKKEMILFESVIKVINQLNMTIVVEGVETLEMVNKIRKIDKNIMIQGFYYSKPVIEADFEEILLNKGIADHKPKKVLNEEPLASETPKEETVKEVTQSAVEEPIIATAPAEEIAPKVIIKEVPVYIKEEPKVIVKPAEAELKQPDKMTKEQLLKDDAFLEELVAKISGKVSKSEPAIPDTNDDDLDYITLVDDIEADDEKEKAPSYSLSDIESIIKSYYDKYKEEWQVHAKDELKDKYKDLVEGVKYYKSFNIHLMDRVLDSEKDIQKAYNTLKNKIMSFDGVKNKLSFRYDSFYIGKNVVMKMTLTTRFIKLFLNLDPALYPNGQFPHSDVSDKAVHKKTPYMMKVQSPLSVKRALILLDDLSKSMSSSVKPDYKERNYVNDLRRLKQKTNK